MENLSEKVGLKRLAEAAEVVEQDKSKLQKVAVTNVSVHSLLPYFLKRSSPAIQDRTFELLSKEDLVLLLKEMFKEWRNFHENVIAERARRLQEQTEKK